MGSCKYCGKSAGFLRKEHKECAAAHAQGLDQCKKPPLQRRQRGLLVCTLDVAPAFAPGGLSSTK